MTGVQTCALPIYLEDLSGLAFDWHDLDARRQQEILRDLKHQGPMLGVVELLDQLAVNGVRCAVVSSSSHAWVDGWLERLAISDRFETVVCRGDAPQIKPAPDLYQEAAKRLQLGPEQCLVIEDSLNGAKAAKAAGMPVWIVPNRVTAGLDFAIADRVFPLLEEVTVALR